MNSKFRDLKFIFDLTRPHFGKLILGTVFLLLGAGVNLLFPQILRQAINNGNGQMLLTRSDGLISELVVLIFLQAVFVYGRSYLFLVIGQDVVADLRKQLYRSLVHQRIAFFDRERTGDLISRLASDTTLIQTAVSVSFSVLARYSLQVVVGTILMAFISLKLTMTILICLPLLVGISMFLGRRLKAASKNVQSELGRANVVAQESLNSIRTVKAFGRENFTSIHYGTAIAKALEWGVRRSRASAFLQSFASFLMYLSLILVVWFGWQLVSNLEIGAGDLAGFLMYGAIVAVSFAFLAGTYADLMQALGGVERVVDLLAEDARDLRPTLTLDQPIRGSLEFRGVDFCYPSRPESKVLKGVTFHIEPGQRVAFVGPSGAGKSTITQLILKFYSPSNGQILFDGIDVSKLYTDNLRSQIAIVSQEPELFSMTIAENLRFAKDGIEDDELLQACKKANLDEFIRSLPNGLETPVGDRGIQLSGGQKQRLAIARAMLRNPKFLILDEATSALDSSNEALVQESLLELMRDRTTLIIAHRLSTVKSVDQVYVIDNGMIVQHGTHDLLKSVDGLYKDFVNKQELA